MSRMYDYERRRLGVDPAAKRAAAGEDQPVCFPGFENREFKIAVERCGRYRLPFHREMMRQLSCTAFDFHQSSLVHRRGATIGRPLLLLRTNISIKFALKAT